MSFGTFNRSISFSAKRINLKSARAHNVNQAWFAVPGFLPFSAVKVAK